MPDDFPLKSQTEAKLHAVLDGTINFPGNGITGLLLYGIPGSGKTTMAELLPGWLETAKTSNYLLNNPVGHIVDLTQATFATHACAQGQNGASVMQNIQNTTSLVSFNTSNLHYVVLDEEKQGDVVKMGAKEIKHANMKDKQDDQEIMEPHSGTEQKFLDAHTIRVTDDPTRDKQDAGKVSRASEPKGKGPGSYDAKEKLGNQKDGIKEATFKTEAGETIDTTPNEKKDTSGKVKGKKIAGDDNDHS